MAPKKQQEPEKRVILGRPGNNVSAGLVGMPNVGKSTTFNLMCNMTVPAENFPFCTIDPSEARVEVPDPNFKHLLEKFKPKNEVPAWLKIHDIAGLVKGASEGEGLGNAFLSHISATDAIFHICRTFEETSDGDAAAHVEGEVNPVRDLEIIADELLKKDIAFMEKTIEPLKKEVSRDGKAKEKKDRLEGYNKILDCLKEGKQARFGDWTGKEIDYLNDCNLLTSKMSIYLVNMSEKDYIKKRNKWLKPLKEWFDLNRPGEMMIPYSAALEAKLVEMESDEARKKYCEENNCKSQIGKIVVEGYHALKLIHFYTCGADEVKCWTIRDGWTAPKAAGTIHTDFERGFIKAEVYSYADFKELGSEQAVKDAGKYRQEGKNYEVKDGDIIFFKFNVTTDAKKK